MFLTDPDNSLSVAHGLNSLVNIVSSFRLDAESVNYFNYETRIFEEYLAICNELTSRLRTH